MRTFFQALLSALLAILALPAGAEIQDKIIQYQDGDTILHGYLYWDDRY